MSRIYTLSSVKFLGLKLRWCKQNDKYQSVFSSPSPLTKSAREGREWRWRQRWRLQRRRRPASSKRSHPLSTRQSGSRSVSYKEFTCREFQFVISLLSKGHGIYCLCGDFKDMGSFSILPHEIPMSMSVFTWSWSLFLFGVNFVAVVSSCDVIRCCEIDTICLRYLRVFGKCVV